MESEDQHHESQKKLPDRLKELEQTVEMLTKQINSISNPTAVAAAFNNNEDKKKNNRERDKNDRGSDKESRSGVSASERIKTSKKHKKHKKHKKSKKSSHSRSSSVDRRSSDIELQSINVARVV